jgi:O-antigen ligase
VTVTEAPSSRAVEPTPVRASRLTDPVVASVLLLGMALVMMALAATQPKSYGLTVTVEAFGLLAVVLGLASPRVAVVYLLVTTFFRLALPVGVLPVDPFILAFGGLIVSIGIWARRHRDELRRPGLLELAIALYVVWNIGSMLSPHPFPPIYPQDGTPLQVGRFLLIGIVMPLVSLLLGRIAFGRDGAIRVLLFSVMGFAAYSAFVSIGQFYLPSLVFPRYIVSSPAWNGRAVGVFNQPLVNGLVMVVGYLTAVLVSSHRAERRLVRVGAGVIAAGCCAGVYLTHTRSAWLSLALVIALGFVMARGWRTGFVVTGGLIALGVALNWSEFTSSDRSAGGVGSTSELEDRLNIAATCLWAVARKPLLGWGLGRFPAVNTYHHQQWSADVPWKRGYGFASHFDILGVAAELGLIGVALWAGVMGVALFRLTRALRSLPAEGHYDGKFATLAMLSLVSLLATGLTVDLRFFDFPNILIMLLVGAAIGRSELKQRYRT